MTGSKKTSEKQARTKNYVLQPMSNAVRPVIKEILPQSSVIFQQLFEIWPDLMKGTEAERSIPEKLVLARTAQKDGVLHVWTQTGAQAMEMNFGKTRILQKINAFFGYNLVADVRVTAFPTKNDNKINARITKRAGKTPCQSLDKTLQDISNPALREVLADLSGVLDAKPSENMEITGDQHA